MGVFCNLTSNIPNYGENTLDLEAKYSFSTSIPRFFAG